MKWTVPKFVERKDPVVVANRQRVAVQRAAV